MSLIPVPIQGAKMSSKHSKWLFDITGGRHERNQREFSAAGFIFTYVRKYFLAFLRAGEEGDRPPWIHHFP